MRVTVNGQEREVTEETTLETLLCLLCVRPAAVVVERNGAIVPRDRHGAVLLAARDRLEIVRLVPGG